MNTLEAKSFDQPDELTSLPKLVGQVLVLGDVHVARYVYEPGWQWSTHVRPLAATPSCLFHHQGVVLSGQIEFTTDDGAQRIAGPGMAFDVPPGHDGRVVGDEACITIEFRGVRDWGKPSDTAGRFLATLVFTDIVGSTAAAASLGDAGWKEVLGRHFDRARLELDRYRGQEIKTTGDGLLAIFDGAARAVRCAAALCRTASLDGLELRAGVHTGEVERRPGDLHGVAVHVAARIAALARAGQTLVSASTVDLLEGSGLSFADYGEHELRGVQGPRRLFHLVAED
jgi:class 3 adenylate cyclase